ncbi:hypothetical protein [Pantoea sp.]|uniref:hypothetical protein n=1 Tax=Pantoea sp. TaxID=69393 RepID=UPI0031DC097B
MKERPILLNAEMVRAVLDGRKTQTRRIIQSPAKNMQASGQKVIDYREPGDKWYGDHVFSMRNQSGTWCDYTREQFLAKCPFGAVGDRLWVRETFSGHYLDDEQIEDIKAGRDKPSELCEYRADYPAGAQAVEGWTPSIHMPRWASRITLEITGVRVERLNSMTERDAIAEGCIGGHNSIPGYHYSATPHEHFHHVWQSIYGADSWQANPWVWVIEFKRVEVE